GASKDLRHAREVRDLAGISPGVELEPPPLPLRIDNREPALGRKVSPDRGVPQRLDPAPVRGDDQRQRRMVLRPVPRGQKHERRSLEAVVRAIVYCPYPYAAGGNLFIAQPCPA